MLSSVFTLLLASVASVFAQAPTLPSQDPFYKQPANVASYKPGDIIRTRQLPPQLSGFAADNVTVPIQAFYQYLYRTTDSLGKPVAAVASFLIPKNANPNKLLAYQSAYDSANNDCSPSYTLQPKSGNASTVDIVFLTSALDNGWYVVNSDYEGLQAQYVAGIQSGQATLDSVRAALNSGSKTGLKRNATLVMWGYSGGALATEWATELAPNYAPELKFAGAAMGGLTPNVTSVLVTVNKGFFASEAFAGIRGLGTAYPNVSTLINNKLYPNKTAEFYSISDGCVGAGASAGAFKDVYSYFQGGLTALDNPVAKWVLAHAGQMGVHGVPKIPLFFYKAVGDEISPVADTDQLYSNLCSKGVSIQYERNLIGEHVSEAITGSASAFSWVYDRFAGKPTQTGCSKKNVVLTSATVGSVAALGQEAIALLQSLLT